VRPHPTLLRFHKPAGVLTQFRDPERPTLKDYIDVPGVYPAGRLDRDSEGLVLLTDDGALQARISHPRHKLEKEYWAQVEAHPDSSDLSPLLRGVDLRDGPAKAVDARPMDPPDWPAREPPVTPHRDARSSWVTVTLTEGRNRQVRRMLAAVGCPVLRLIRVRIGPVTLDGLPVGRWERITARQCWHATR